MSHGEIGVPRLQAPTQQEITAACDAITESRSFRTTRTTALLLRFLVEQALAGTTVNEELILSEFMKLNTERQLSDARKNRNVPNAIKPIRSRLQKYYTSLEGQRASVRIELPEWGYTPRFHRIEPKDSRPTAMSPYVGPQPFSPAQTDLFFGRERECSELIDHIQIGEKRVILLYSPSGAGKTSLINTALRAALVDLDFEVLPIARVGPPVQALGAKFSNFYTATAISSISADHSGEDLSSETWAQYLKSVLQAGRKGLVLIIDQLEEIVPMNPPLGPKKQKHDFFLQLREAIEEISCLRVILSCREEYKSALEKRLARDLLPFAISFDLERLTLEAAKEAIIVPANRYLISFEPEVVEALVRHLASDRYEDENGFSRYEQGEFVEPLQLQIVCDALWAAIKTVLSERIRHISWIEIEKIVSTSVPSRQITKVEDCIREFVDFVLKNFCGQAIEKVATNNNVPVGSIDLRCQQFITKRGARQLVHQGVEKTGELPNAIVFGLEQHRLLRAVERNDERFYELAHDTLIEPMRERAERALIFQRRSRFPRIVAAIVACVIATIGAVAVTMIARAFLAAFRLTLTQAPDVGLVAGWFHGVIGALVWSVCISAALCLSWFLVPRQSDTRFLGSYSPLVGLFAGLIGGVFITIALLWAQRPDSLYGALWTSSREAAARWTAFTVTGFGYSMLLFGAGVGWGCGHAGARIVTGKGWEDLVNRYPKPTSWTETQRVLKGILRRVVLTEGWLVLVPLMVAGGLFYLLVLVYRLNFHQPQLDEVGNLSRPLWARTLGDCLSISCGGFGLLIGLLFGLFLLRKGLDVPDERIFSFLSLAKEDTRLLLPSQE